MIRPYRVRDDQDVDVSRQMRPGDVGPDEAGNYACAYESCNEQFAMANDRLRHLFLSHRMETEWRLSAIEEHLGGDWRLRAACRGRGDEWIREPTSRDKATARETGRRHLTKSERRACAICAGCPVRRDCAKASLTPVPASTELPMARPILFEPYGIWCGVPADARKQLVAELGTGSEALEALLQLGERFAREYPPRTFGLAHGPSRP